MKKNKEPKIKPFKPLPFREGNKVLRTFERIFMDRVGNKAIIKYCDYEDKKKKKNEDYVLQIKWIDEGFYFSKEEVKNINDCFLTKEESKEMEKAACNYIFSEPDWYLVYYDGPRVYFFTHNDEYYLGYDWDTIDTLSNEFVYFKIGTKEKAKHLSNFFRDKLYRGEFENIMNFVVYENYEPFLHVYMNDYDYDYIVRGDVAKRHVNELLTKYNIMNYEFNSEKSQE